MQVFVAMLSNLIDEGEFEKSWRLDCAGNLFRDASVVIAGRKVSLTLEPGPDGRWQTEIVTGLDILDGRVRFTPSDFATVFPL